MKAWRLVADIGGSNARFARSERDGAVHDIRSYSVPDYPSFEATLSTYPYDPASAFFAGR